MKLLAPLTALILLGWWGLHSAAGSSREVANPAADTSREQGIAPEARGWDRAGSLNHPRAPRATRSRTAQHLAPLPHVLLSIRWCESRNDYRAENRHSTASGAFQVLDSTWHHFAGYTRAKYAPRHVQDRQALRLFRASGTRPWNASRRCWA